MNAVFASRICFSRCEYLELRKPSGSGTESDVKQKRVEPFGRPARAVSEGRETRSPRPLGPGSSHGRIRLA